MDDIIERIQQDILDRKVSLSDILLKAKVLGYRLKNDEFKKWVKSELDGYMEQADVPDYRILTSYPVGTLTNGARTYTNDPVQTIILPPDLQDEWTKVHITEGVRAVEELSGENNLGAQWPQSRVSYFNALRARKLGDSYGYSSISLPLPGHAFTQILTTVRSRLQDFILEISDLPWKVDSNSQLPKEEVQRLVNQIILHNHAGVNMTTFNQQGQHVNAQYNAGRDINISAVQYSFPRGCRSVSTS